MWLLHVPFLGHRTFSLKGDGFLNITIQLHTSPGAITIPINTQNRSTAWVKTYLKFRMADYPDHILTQERLLINSIFILQSIYYNTSVEYVQLEFYCFFFLVCILQYIIIILFNFLSVPIGNCLCICLYWWWKSLQLTVKYMCCWYIYRSTNTQYANYCGIIWCALNICTFVRYQ